MKRKNSGCCLVELVVLMFMLPLKFIVFSAKAAAVAIVALYSGLKHIVAWMITGTTGMRESAASQLAVGNGKNDFERSIVNSGFGEREHP